MHETSLVGIQAKASYAFGSFDSKGGYAGNAPGSGEADFEQDLFGAVRVLERGQLSLLAPLVETWRTTRTTGGEAGGGLGDVNFGARADLFLAGQSRFIPGIALLGGLTMPSGVPPDGAKKTLATDATGIGAYQGNFGLAVEQNFGAWLVNLTGIVAFRTERNVHGIHETLAPQLTALAALGYTFSSEAAIAVIVSYLAEGDASNTPDSGRRLLTTSLAGVYPMSDTWRVQGTVFLHPPIESLGQNQTTATGLSLTLIKSWL
jgi:hypothetical protein